MPSNISEKGVSFEMLDKLAYAKSDIEAGEEMKKEKEDMFSRIKIR
jgi:hypothetical protein